MEFLYYDLIFLVIFCLFVFFFLRAKRKKIQREGVIFLYKTKLGLRFIDRTAKKFKKILDPLGNISIVSGFTMMVAIFYFLIKSILLTIKIPINVPPVLPLFPYIPQAFKLPLPPFYFTYWIIIIVVIAVTHEFAHGIYSRYNKVKVKSTGFGFLGPFLAAFVEPDEKGLEKKKSKAQLEVFSAGSFSNLVFAVIFMLTLQLFFILAYQPAGISFMFSYSSLNISEIKSIGSYNVQEFFNLSDKELATINKTLAVQTENDTYYMNKELISEIPSSRKIIEKYNRIIVYDDTPAFRAGLEGGLQKIDNYTIKKVEDVSKVLSSYRPGDKVKIITSESEYDLILGKHPLNESTPYLGISFQQMRGANLILSSLTSPFFSPHTYVKARGNEKTTIFFRDLLIWLVLICFFVAIFNMLPVTVLDGGKMLFVLTFAITKSKKKAKSVLGAASYIVLLLILAMIFVWLVG
ncbi:MAG: site-2 protease family protein [Candidatus Pacearchaeota archaeon]